MWMPSEVPFILFSVSADLINMMQDFYDWIDEDGSGGLDAKEFLFALQKFGKVFYTLYPPLFFLVLD